MAYEKFIDKNFYSSSHTKITQSKKIIDEYYDKGFKLTLRQLYYQFVARGWLKNEFKEYKSLGEVAKDARLAGLIDWSMIEDRTRVLKGRNNHRNVKGAYQELFNNYSKDMWIGQDTRVEVWVEKEALAGVIQKACVPFDVDFFSCRGFVSVSSMYDAGRRLKRYNDAGLRVKYLYLGDFDPSGMEIPISIEKYLNLFAPESDFDFERIALNADQIKQYKPPSDYAKLTDSRALKFIAEHGDKAYELDALDPQVIVDLIQENIKMYIEDADAWRNREEETAWDKYQISNHIKGLR